MALTFTLRHQGRIDDKKLRIYDVTHDNSTTDIEASSIGLNYVDVAIMTASTVVAPADLTTNNGATLVVTPLSSGSITSLWAIGT